MTDLPRATLNRAVDRFPHALVAEGEQGTVVTYTPELVRVHLDSLYDGLEEWDNCLHWYAGMDPSDDDETAIEAFLEDVTTDTNGGVWFDSDAPVFDITEAR